MSENNEMNRAPVDTGMDELEAMFGTSLYDMEKFEEVTLSQSLEGFASCFPDWDLHPPVRR